MTELTVKRSTPERLSRAAVAAAGLAVLALFVSLGMWQLRRADEQALLFARLSTAADLPVLTVPLDVRRADDYRFRRLALRGRYDASRQFLLDSMTHEGQAGYHVLTPFRPLAGERWLLVNRGWVEADPDRRSLPALQIEETVRAVDGWIDTLPRPGLRLAAVAPTTTGDWPMVLLFPTFEELEARLGAPLYRYQLLLEPASSDGFIRDWAPRTMAPERHVGYAIQWFGLAAVLMVMALIVGVRAARHRGR